MAVCSLKGDCTLGGIQFLRVQDRHHTVPLLEAIRKYDLAKE